MNHRSPDWQATRWSLLARLRNWEDHESWREFFDAYWRLIYSVAVRAGLSETEAQDVVQDTVLSVAKSIHQFKCDPAAGSFKAWLLQLTRWRILNQMKRRLPTSPGGDAPSPAHVPRSNDPGDDEQNRTATVERVADPAGLSLEAVWEREWQENLAEAAKETVQRQVSARQFQIFELSVVQGWPVRQVAQMLGINPGQVYLARHRVGRLLKRERSRLESQLADGPPRRSKGA